MVRHADLQRASADSPFRSWCPVCEKGLLLVRRMSLTDIRLSKLDNCSMCGQSFWYEEDVIDGETLFSPIPLTLEETVPALDKLLCAEDRDYLQKADDINAAIADLHHTLGRYLRNTWCLWHGSPLALLLKEKGVEHPDDMSHAILANYARAKYPTRYQRIASDDDEV